jgi:hypothetical protein
MSDIVEAMDIDGQLYVSAHNLPEFLERAMERGAEIERARVIAWLRSQGGHHDDIYEEAADDIGNGEHLKEQGK